MIDTNEIKQNICYTELVYARINKKLRTNYSKKDIETLISDLLQTTPADGYSKVGKNYYITNRKKNIRVTVNSYTYRVITVDRVDIVP